MSKIVIRQAPTWKLPNKSNLQNYLPAGEPRIKLAPPSKQERARFSGERRTPVAKYAKTKRWKEVRSEALDRAHHRCEKCGTGGTGVLLEADHIVPVRMGGQRYDLDNVQVLCRKCHYSKTLRDKRVYPQLSRKWGSGHEGFYQ